MYMEKKKRHFFLKYCILDRNIPTGFTGSSNSYFFLLGVQVPQNKFSMRNLKSFYYANTLFTH